MSGRGKPGDVGGKVPKPRESGDSSEEPSVEESRQRRRRASSSTWNEWPAVELTPPARKSRPALPLTGHPDDTQDAGQAERSSPSHEGAGSGGRQGRERAPSSPFVRDRTPVPSLPGEGPGGVGTDPGLDDAWTSDVDDWTVPTTQRKKTAPPQDFAFDPTVDKGAAAGSGAAAGDEYRDGDSIEIGALDLGTLPTTPLEPVLVEEQRPPEAQGKGRGRDSDDPGADAPTTEFRISVPDAATGSGPGRPRAPSADLELDLDEVFDAPSEDEAEFTDAASYRSVLLASLDRDAPPGESPGDRLRRRLSALIERAQSEYIQGTYEAAITALELVWSEDPDNVITHKVTQHHHDFICEIYEAFLGDTDAVLTLAMPMSEIRPDSLNSRTAFLLTRIDGMMTVEDLLDVAGMPRIEALRYLCSMQVEGILKRAG